MFRYNNYGLIMIYLICEVSFHKNFMLQFRFIFPSTITALLLALSVTRTYLFQHE